MKLSKAHELAQCQGEHLFEVFYFTKLWSPKGCNKCMHTLSGGGKRLKVNN